MVAAVAAVAAALVLAGCGGDEDPASLPTPTPTEPLWNPCDALEVAEVGAWFDARFTQDTGTPTAPVCTFSPEVEGGPAVDANYMLFPEGLDAVFETMTLDPEDVREVRVPGADAARVVVDFDDRQLFVSGFVQNGDLIQTVDVVDPRPYDETRVVRAVRSILAEFSAAAPDGGS